MNLDLRTYSTFTIGGIAHKVFEIKTKEDIQAVDSYCLQVQKPLVIIGEGSNSIFADSTDKYIIGLMQIQGIEVLDQTDTTVSIKSYAGEKWDDVVAWSIEHGFSGLEALSGIPGTTGAAPIQNIGAYGSDISQTFVEAEVFDRETKSFYSVKHNQCEFGYRESIFKKEKDKYIIVSITLQLSTLPAQIPQYKDVHDYFISNTNPNIKEIRNAILEIRRNKIPDYKKYPNCGSFFKNPIITKAHLEIIQKSFPLIPSFELPNKMYKVFTGWLIEHVEFQKAQTHTIVFNEKNKLILLNINNGTFEDLRFVLDGITNLVKEAYNINLEIEPNIFE